MATNADEETPVETDVVEDLQKAKLESETNPDTSPELSDQDAQSEESPAEGEKSPEATLTTTSESEHDLDWYKKAYEESTKEALRLKALADTPPVIESQETKTGTLTPEQLYIKQKQDEEIATAYGEFSKNYPQVKDPEEYKKFTAMANTFGKTILDAEGRLATPKELYAKTAIALGWTADDSREELAAAVKDGASSPRISSGAGQSSQTSKVTDEMITINRKMYPGKTDAEIREELEPHVQ